MNLDSAHHDDGIEKNLMHISNQNLLFKIIKKSNDYVVLFDSSGKIIALNQKIEKTLKYQRKNLIGKHISELPFLSAQNRELALMKFSDRLKKKNFKPYNLEFRAKNGDTFFGEINASIITMDSGEIVNLVTIRDVSERILYEKSSEKIEKRFKTIFDSDINGITEKNLPSGVYFVNLRTENSADTKKVIYLK